MRCSMRRNKILFYCAVFLVFVLSGTAFPAKLLARSPLLIEGKKTLYQRVITHPAAFSCEAPGFTEGNALASFTPLYVYAHAKVKGEDWLELGPSISSERTFWVKATYTSRWDKALSLMPTLRMTRNPLLFFDSKENLENFISSENLAAKYQAYLKSYKAKTLGTSSPVIAVEDVNSAIPQDRFYLMPIFEYSTEYDHYNFRMLKIGSINPGKAENKQSIAPASFKAGMAFIVDTTISMGPYIEQTKAFINETYSQLEKQPLADRLALGVVAYRNNPAHNSKLEYVSKVISDFTPATSRQKLESQLSSLNEAVASTHSYNEDAFAGIKEALEALSWQDYSVKIAVLVTDAGAIRNTDKYSSTMLNEEQMRDLLAKHGIQLIVLYLETPAAKRNHSEQTQKQYQTLTRVQDGSIKHKLIAINAKNAQEASVYFKKLATTLSNTLVRKVREVEANEQPSQPKLMAEQGDTARLSYIADCLGYAAHLDFLGKENTTEAPRFVEAWTTDKDLIHLTESGGVTETVQVTVLLSKHQLNNLATQLANVLEAARLNRSNSDDFFKMIISLAAQTVRDPAQLQSASITNNIAELGALPEFLEGLPYVSRIMGMTAESWIAMNSEEQDLFIADLHAKLNLYKDFDNDRANWSSFGSTDPLDALYRVPLSALP